MQRPTFSNMDKLIVWICNIFTFQKSKYVFILIVDKFKNTNIIISYIIHKIKSKFVCI